MCVEDLKLSQLLADPIVRLVMASDGVRESDLWRLATRSNEAELATIPPPMPRAPQLGRAPAIF